mmetsp:Transcript_11591/g.34809  ORF Transcript_11591/g.34809 Transcript_11591/m.34809 type:complete len:226 (-) Transcript_11591:1061-1738(-)
MPSTACGKDLLGRVDRVLISISTQRRLSPLPSVTSHLPTVLACDTPDGNWPHKPAREKQLQGASADGGRSSELGFQRPGLIVLQRPLIVPQLVVLSQIFIPVLLEQNAGQVALAERGQHGDDKLAAVLGAAGHLDGSHHRRPRGDAHHEALLLRQPPCHHYRLMATHPNDFIKDVHVQNLRHKSGADALYLMEPGLAPSQHRRLLGLHSDQLHRGVALFQVLACP